MEPIDFISAAAMVWHIYLLTTNDEHLLPDFLTVEWNGAGSN